MAQQNTSLKRIDDAETTRRASCWTTAAGKEMANMLASRENASAFRALPDLKFSSQDFTFIWWRVIEEGEKA